MSESTKLPFRFTFREEGEWVVARLQPSAGETGEIIELARVRTSVLRAYPDGWADFKSLIQKSGAEIIRDIVGVAPTFGEEPAAEHERSGRA